MKEIELPKNFELQDIKTERLCENKLNEIIALSGSVESLFSKRSMKYRSMGLHEVELTDFEMKNLILEEYTFLKRPVAIVDDEIFIGNSKKVVEALKTKIHS